ncbi:TonB-dependent receptor [Methylophilus glucosoxydans]|uniref:TonB-dependent receptor n=1 Tax=Methylophilus glucosoxydans TaxID=752553 RepID=A0ABW3GHJ6_9PROT
MNKQAVKPLLMAILSAYAAHAVAVQAEEVQLDKVEVISTTPLNGVGVPLEHIPAGVQQVKQKELVKQKSLTLGDYMNQNMLGVNVNETQNNPFQPDVNYHGFTASPLLGTPQGLSVYVDGVRVNEAFGDVVNWDLIPMNAINQMTLIPGSNPLFGLNTLGGAISVQTKSGRTNQGGAVEAYTGSWGRHVLNAEYGGVSEDGSKDFFISGNSFEEDGWRSFSASRVKQLFTKAGWQNEKTAVNLSLSLADNKMRGNGLQAGSLLDSLGYKSNFTVPDQTKNNMAFVNLNLSHYFADDIQLSGNVYYRDVRTKTFNGDLNDTFELAPGGLDDNNADCSAGNDADENCSGAINRSRLTQKSYGFTSQLTFSQDLLGLKNQFISGLGYNRGKTKFSQNTEFGLLNSYRGVDGNGEFNALTDQVNLSGVNRTWSVFATDTLSLNPYWHVTASARYNTTKIDNDDKITPSGSGSLTGTHSFNRLNPSLGINFTPSNQLTAYASYSESSRAPTSIELGCADENNPCKLPNAMAGDPPLKQVVSKTYDAGLRGFLTPTITWSLGAYHTINTNDIQFLTTANNANNGAGFFSNISKTKRQGLDASLAGRMDAFSWNLGYSFVQATYESSFLIANQVNTSAIDTDGQNGVDSILVKKGDYLAGIPKHQLKLGLGYDVTSAWNVGSNIVAFSSQYSRGNENNKDTSSGAKVRGYTVVNLFTNYRFDNGWNIFARVNNVFDREYYSLGMLGQNPIDPTTGQFSGNETNDTFYAPGAPRAGWIGARYDFGVKKSVASYDKD